MVRFGVASVSVGAPIVCLLDQMAVLYDVAVSNKPLKKETDGVGVDALSAVHEITAKIVASLDLNETLATIARAMCEVLAADVGAIYLLDEQAGVIRLRGIYGQRSKAWDGHTMGLDRGMNAMAIRTGQIQRVDDYFKAPPEMRAQTPVDEQPFGAVITAPLTHRGKRLGSMAAVRHEPRPFSDRELVLLEMLADHASIAVANALAHEELETLRARETAQFREHADRMAALDRAKSEFLQLASHELRSPIGVVRGYLSMLNDGSLRSSDLSRVLPMLMAKTQQVNVLINEMLETARLDTGPLELQLRRVDLRNIVRLTVDRMEPLLPADAPIRLSLPPQPVTVEADAGRIETALTNLLDNAIKYSPDKPEVSCGVSVNDGRAYVEIRDTGIGIAREDLPRLFQRFSRISSESTRTISGTGLGLYIARELVQRHRGDITVSSTPGSGSAFCVSLPLAAHTTP
jgi:signal transduction histidine kinase